MFKKIPHTYTLIFGLIVLAAVLTWIVPAGEFERAPRTTESGQTVNAIVPDSYHSVNAQPQTWQVFSAFFKGFQKAPGIIAFILILGGTFWIINESKAIDIGVQVFLQKSERLKRFKVLNFLGVHNIIITMIMLMFSFFGAVFGMSEETIAFVIIFVPLAISMGYDSIVGVCMCFIAAGLGFAGCFLNPFTLGIAQDIAGIPMFSGIEYRLVIWTIVNIVGIAYVLRYAARVKRNPTSSPVYHEDAHWREQKASAEELSQTLAGSGNVKKSQAMLALYLLLLSVILLVVGVTVFGWGFQEIAALFFGLGVVTGISMKMDATTIIKNFVAGAKDILGAALVVGLASGIIVILEDGKIIDTFLHAITNRMKGASDLGALSLMYGFQSILNAIITSGTAKAAMLMPIFSEIANMIGLSLQATVTAFHIGDGFTNLITPTSGVLIGVLEIAKIPYVKWVKWAWKLIAMLVVLGFLLLIPMVSCTQENSQPVRFEGKAQGTYYAITYYDEKNTNYQPQIDSILDTFDCTASLWETNSEINAVNENKDIILSPMFQDIFQKAVWASEKTSGAFDFTIGPLVKMYGFWSQKREEITDEKIAEYLQWVDYKNVRLIDNHIVKTNPNIKIDFNAIAKGYSVDLLGKFLAEKGIDVYLIDIGGEVLAKGRKPNGDKWRVGIEKPAETAYSSRELETVIEMDNGALATSGNYRKYYEKDGKRYAHTIDPKTGKPVEHTLLSVTVKDSVVWRADALATAMMTLGVEKSLKLLETLPNVEACFISAGEKNTFVMTKSKGF